MRLPPSASTTKSATVLTLLRREQGSTLAELVEATSWQPHTARAMLTGLRKKGHAIERRKRGDLTCYHLPSAEA
jgi:DNA-binding IclR family transcriptional regulator